MTLATPWLAALGPAVAVALWLLERWRRRPIRVVVADLALFEPSPEAAAEARARRRHADLALALRALAALLLGLAAAGPRAAWGPPGPVAVDLVLDRGLSSGFRAGEGTRLDLHRGRLAAVLERLRPGDEVRLHLAPGDTVTGPPGSARRAIDQAAPAAALPGLEGRLEPLIGRAQQTGLPVFVATDRALEGGGSALAVAVSGAPRPDRGVVALGEAAAGDALEVAVAWSGATGPVEVRLVAEGPRGGLAKATVTVTPGEVDPRGRAWGFARWSAAAGYPRGARAASAELAGPPDGLPTNDRAFAVRPPRRARRVGLVGRPAPDVRRALEAVPGAVVVDLDQAPPPGAAGFDLLVLPRLPDALPACAVAVVPPAIAGTSTPGGPVSPGSAPAFAHSLAALAREGLVVPDVAPLPPGLPRAAVLAYAGQAPLLVTRGAGRQRVLLFSAPPEGAGGWTRRASFPLLWAELLEDAAPLAAGVLASLPAGDPWPEGAPDPRPLLSVGRFAAADGTPWVGTAAPPLPTAAAPSPQGFPPTALERLEAARPGPPARALAPWLVALAALLTLAGWARADR